MKKLEQNLGVESLEFPDGGKTLKEQLQAKNNAIEDLPSRENVSGKSCKIWGRAWSYFGSWLKWGKNNLDCPWGGEWLFKSDDNRIELKWNWDKEGTFVGKSVVVNWQSFTRKRTTYEKGNPTRILSLECSSNVNWLNYDCKLDENFQLSEITYSWITLKLTHENGKSYLVNNGGRKLELWSSIAENLATIRIAKAISIVRNAIENGEKDGLDYFEYDEPEELQADYLGTWRDTTIYRNCKSSTWVTASRLVSWLNASRWDFGL